MVSSLTAKPSNLEDEDSHLATPLFTADFVSTTTTTYSIGNLVWLDEDGDGDQDAGEIGIGGVAIYLEDVAGGLIASTITDFKGGYIFEGLSIGTYTVIIDDLKLPVGLQNPTYDKDGILDNESTVTLSASSDLSLDFGYNFAPAAATNNPSNSLGAIGDRVWSDANGDGLQDPNEVGIAGVSVYLLNDAGTPMGLKITDDAGYFVFDNLQSGVYSIQILEETLPDRFTAIPTGDPDGDNNNVSDKIPLAPGDVYLNMDFGYNDPTGYNIGNRIYLDANVSGFEEVGELPIPNVSVALIADTNANGTWEVGELPIATDLTDATGDYLFTGLGDGDYIVMVTNTNNVLVGLENSVDGDGDSNGYSAVTIAGADNWAQDFGYTPVGHTAAAGIIGNLIFLDADGNGVYSVGDYGIEGVDVNIYNSANVLLCTATTNANGNYLVGGLVPGIYIVEVAVGSIPNGLSNNIDPDGGNNNNAVVTLASAGQHLDQDFGYDAVTPNAISGTLWEDRDANGAFDELSTIYFENVTVLLKNDSGNTIATTVTDITGDYAFTGLPDGTYTIEVTDNHNILNGHWLSDGSSAVAKNNVQKANFTVSNGSGIANDFGFYKDGASLGNLVWDDANANGTQDAGEAGMSEVVITLVIDYPGGTTLTLTETTDANGHYSFDNLLMDEDYNNGVNGLLPTYTLSAEMAGGYQLTVINVSGDGSNSENPAGTTAFPMQGMDDPSSNAAPNNEQYTAFYDFGFAPTPLAVTLTNFSGEENECNVILKWESEIETNFSHYVVERATNNLLTFEYLFQVAAQQTTGIKSYVFEDVEVTGKMYYRLKMFNLDGTFEYSDIVAISTDCGYDITGIQLFPNPIGIKKSILDLNFTNQSKSSGWIIITDNLGKEHSRFPVAMEKGENVMEVDVANLSSGIYYISIIPENGKVTTKQFVKSKD